MKILHGMAIGPAELCHVSKGSEPLSRGRIDHRAPSVQKAGLQNAVL